MRSILSVIVGYVVKVVVALVIDLAIGVLLSGWHGTPGQPPPTLHRVLYVLYTTVSAIAGGYIAALIAQRLEVRHALAVGSIAFLFSMRPVVSNLDGDLTWVQITVPFLVLSGALLGGYLRMRSASKKRPADGSKHDT